MDPGTLGPCLEPVYQSLKSLKSFQWAVRLNSAPPLDLTQWRVPARHMAIIVIAAKRKLTQIYKILPAQIAGLVSSRKSTESLFMSVLSDYPFYSVNSGTFFTSQGLGPENLMRSFLEELSPFANVPSSSEPEDEIMLDDYDEPHPRRSGRRSGGNRHTNNVERITVRFPSQPVLTPTVRLSSSGNPLLMHFISGLNPLQGDIRNYVLNQEGIANNVYFMKTGSLEYVAGRSVVLIILIIRAMSLTKGTVARVAAHLNSDVEYPRRKHYYEGQQRLKKTKRKN
ncbi:uncharacterized protein DEA37_0003849 [Paragonimus westermani]|uniref:Uncharacterized protein n=1 Tax=Paragonimus westermani TaxID=34504 RepID=A0A5J4NDD8_9TREM|nr:uncharacterized protein DEA37_0003849 [Paragonimus westermani]